MGAVSEFLLRGSKFKEINIQVSQRSFDIYYILDKR